LIVQCINGQLNDADVASKAHPMNLRQLQTLIIIADAGGFARAAGRPKKPARAGHKHATHTITSPASKKYP
jgi:hypothetical protein